MCLCVFVCVWVCSLLFVYITYKYLINSGYSRWSTLWYSSVSRSSVRCTRVSSWPHSARRTDPAPGMCWKSGEDEQLHLPFCSSKLPLFDSSQVIISWIKLCEATVRLPSVFCICDQGTTRPFGPLGCEHNFVPLSLTVRQCNFLFVLKKRPEKGGAYVLGIC